MDPTRSHVGFSIRHLRVGTVRGRFRSFSGQVRDVGDGLRIDGRVDTASVDTGHPIRDDQLRIGFFQAERFPTIEFGARCTTPAPGESWLVGGTLIIRNALQPVVLRATAEPVGPDALRVEAECTIRRSNFGLEWAALREAGRLRVADLVQVHVDVVLAREPGTGDR